MPSNVFGVMEPRSNNDAMAFFKLQLRVSLGVAHLQPRRVENVGQNPLLNAMLIAEFNAAGGTCSMHTRRQFDTARNEGLQEGDAKRVIVCTSTILRKARRFISARKDKTIAVE